MILKNLISWLNKAKRLADEVLNISVFLKTIPSLAEVFALANTNSNEIFNQVSMMLKLESSVKNKVIFRIGKLILNI